MQSEFETRVDASGCVTYIAPPPMSNRERRKKIRQLVHVHRMSSIRAEQVVDLLTEDEIDDPVELPAWVHRRDDGR
jgi:hypothetical protein